MRRGGWTRDGNLKKSERREREIKKGGGEDGRKIEVRMEGR